MKNKIISIVLIALCLLSIIVGITNNSFKIAKEESSTEQKASDLLKNISSMEDKIALISLQGVISSESSSSGFMMESNSAQSVLKSLEKAVEDNSVKGVILRINSPGGTVAMSQEIYSAIIRLRKMKPVVVSMEDVAASGGYYIASAADRIYANPGTLTGSIGVIMSTLNLQGFMGQKLGIESVVIKSGKFKDTGSSYRKMTVEEHSLLQNLINSAYNQFLTSIIEGRVKRKDTYKAEKVLLTNANLKKYADGRILTGEQAKKYGFVDKLGSLYEAKAEIRKMAKEKFPAISDKVPVINYNRPTDFGEILFGTATESILPIKKLESQVPFSLSHPRQPLFMWE